MSGTGCKFCCFFRPPCFFAFRPLLMTKGPTVGPNGFEENRCRLLRNHAGDRMQILLFFRPPCFFAFRPLLSTEGPIVGPNGFEKNRCRLLRAYVGGRMQIVLLFFDLFVFYFPAPLNYQGADIRTARIRSKPISVGMAKPKGGEKRAIDPRGPR